MRPKAVAVVVAAGEGTRLGGSDSKTYLPIAGRPLILRTLDRFVAAQTIDWTVVVIAQRDRARCRSLIAADPNLNERSWIFEVGGASRQESVQRGLERAADLEPELVVIHDGARPFVTSSLIDRCVEEATLKGAVVVGLPVRDTIKIVSEERKIQATPDRSSLWEIQTPQVFRCDLIVRAYQWASGNNVYATDDASLVEQLGHPVYVLNGERTNLKITVPEDVVFAEALIGSGWIR